MMTSTGGPKQRVLLVHNHYQIPGGEDTVVANEMKLLREHGHEVMLYSRSNNELKHMGTLRKLGLAFTTVFNPKTYRNIRRLIREQHIDIVHVHNTLNLISPAVYYAAVSCGVPVVQTVHNFRLLCPGATFYRDGRICEDCVSKGLACAVKHGCYRHSRLQTLACVISTWIHRWLGIYSKIHYIALTEFNREKMLQLRQIGREQVFVKPNFTFENALCAGLHEGGYYLFIGRVEAIKGMELLLKAFAGMPDRRLKIAGTGTEIGRYQAQAPENVEFLGLRNRAQLAEDLAGCKAVIVPSQCYETFGMIIVEAYAAHRPVIVGDIGNIAGLVDEGVTGLKFKYDDPAGLQSAVERFESMDEKRLGENGYRKYLEQYSAQVNYQLLRDIYDGIQRR